jgi:hypothetical protein
MHGHADAVGEYTTLNETYYARLHGAVEFML